MSVRGCERRDEVVAGLRMGHWPEAAAEELRAHVKGCRGCTDVVAVESALRGERGRAMAQARLEPAELVWWRAQLRKRREVLAQVGRPIWGAQVFAIVVSVCVAVGFGAWQVQQGFGVRTWVSDGWSAAEMHGASVLGAWGWVPLLAVGLMMAGMVGMALYLAVNLRGERE